MYLSNKLKFSFIGLFKSIGKNESKSLRRGGGQEDVIIQYAHSALLL